MPAARNGAAKHGAASRVEIEAERSTLGAMLIEMAAIPKARQVLNSPDFSRREHQIIYGAILALYDDETVPDMTTLPAVLEKQGQLEAVGGMASLMGLFDAVGTAANITHYAGIVKEASQKRQIWQLSQKVQAATESGVEDVSGMLKRVAEDFARIGGGNESESDAAEVPPGDGWPVPDQAMYHGIVGDVVRIIGPHTEADDVALVVQFLLAFGSAIGRCAHFVAEADKHFGNLYAVIVGVSSKGRKGSSWGQIKRLFDAADPIWSGQCIARGLSSGEGLIWQVRDPIEKEVADKKTGATHTEILDAGVKDKRVLIIESEFASLLRVLGREGNTLSSLIRNAWDTGDLQSLTKNSPAKATGAHVSIIGHVTRDELRRELSSTEAGNGFGNRFLWLCVRRSKQLPEGGNLEAHELNPLVQRLQKALTNARGTTLLKRDQDARAAWIALYNELSEGKPGLAGSVTSRGEAQVMRLACLYALLDQSDLIRVEHLRAAVAVWEYVEASARFVFGDSLGDGVADDILRSLRGAPEGRTRNELRELFGRHQSSGRIAQALELLKQHGYAESGEPEKTDGRPAERWYAKGKTPKRNRA